MKNFQKKDWKYLKLSFMNLYDILHPLNIIIQSQKAEHYC